jgi:membrane carboxypeptidase/penicillin-binding protein PbpC
LRPGEILSSDQVKLSLENLPQGWLEMLLAVEDPDFYTHNGMDRATPEAGITTITQNLVKRMYFENFEPGVAKLRQTLIAVFALDPLVPKETQLVLFINIAPMGRQGDKRIRGFADGFDAYVTRVQAALNKALEESRDR